MGNIIWFTILNAILLVAQITNINAQDSQPLGRLLSPEEGCGISKVANTKIVGGIKAKPGAFPWMALIGEMMNNGKMIFDCGGSLITSRHVLTAAHCVRANGSYVARLGEHDRTMTNDGERQDNKVIRVDGHTNYSRVEEFGSGHNDIAILTLERDVKFNDRIRPICLPLSEELQNNSFVDDNPFVAGWGKLDLRGKFSDVLMQVQVPVVENELCEKLHKIKYKHYIEHTFNDMIICAGVLTGGEGFCHGDSGGPLMLPILQNGQFPMYQIGIVSWGLGCAHPYVPGIYTRVSKFIDWIQEKIDQK